MDKRVFAFLEWLDLNLGVSGIFFILLAVELLLSLLCLLLTLCKCGYGIKNRLWLVFCGIFLLTVDIAFTLHYHKSALFPLVLFAFIALTVGVILLLPEKQGVFTKESLTLAEFLSKRAKEQGGETPVYRENTERIKAGGGQVCLDREEGEKAKEDLGLDFTHVKNVIERLNCFSLTPSDKRQVKELETALFKAESGEGGDMIKEQVNDGLSALLKIMSKYGV